MFKVINPSNEAFAALQAQVAQAATRLDYNTLAEQYNTAEVNGILAFDYKVSKVAALRIQLEKRGLKNAIDFVAAGAKVDGVETAYITRLTDVQASQLEAKPRGPRKAAGEVATAVETPAE